MFNFRIIIFISGIFAFYSSIGQEIRFSDTIPVSNSDSLKQWLNNNKEGTLVRFKNLAKLERMRLFSTLDGGGKSLEELRQLAKHLNSTSGKAIYCYLKGVFLQQDDNLVLAYDHLIQAKDLFTSLKDTSGLINTLVELAYVNYDNQYKIRGQKGQYESYIIQAKYLLAKSYNLHDYLPIAISDFIHLSAQNPKDAAVLLRNAQESYNLYKNEPEFAFAHNILKRSVAIAYYWQGKYAESYRVNKEILASLRPNEIAERIVLLNNLSNDCLLLGYYKERSALALEGLKLFKDSRNNDPRKQSWFFRILKEEAYRKGLFKQAVIYADSFQVYNEKFMNQFQEQKLIDAQAKYETSEKQKQIAELKLKQNVIESRNRLVIVVLIITLLVSAILGFLWFRMRHLNELLSDANVQLKAFNRTRQQFFAIIAHDLRKPFHAFQSMNELISHYIKKNDSVAIKKICQSIDESGLKNRQLLDNLLIWAFSQNEEVPYDPKHINLFTHIQSVIQIYNSIYTYQSVKFILDCPKDIIIFTDVNAFELILRNLVSNALSAISYDEGIINISAKAVANKVELSVTDNGKGLDDVKLEVFRRVLANPNINEARQNGLGFGLVLIAKFAIRNNINVSCQTKIGEGTCFNLLLPTS